MERTLIVDCKEKIGEKVNISGYIQAKRDHGKIAFLELDLAKPILYASYSKYWLKGYPNLSRLSAVAELRQTHADKLVFSPSFEVLEKAFGKEFKLTRKKGGVRYDLVEVLRIGG